MTINERLDWLISIEKCSDNLVKKDVRDLVSRHAKCIKGEYLVTDEIRVRYAINQALADVSPLTVMFALMFKGRIWLQDKIVEKLEKYNVNKN